MKPESEQEQFFSGAFPIILVCYHSITSRSFLQQVVECGKSSGTFELRGLARRSRVTIKDMIDEIDHVLVCHCFTVEEQDFIIKYGHKGQDETWKGEMCP